MAGEVTPGAKQWVAACWCGLDDECHGDVLLDVANGGEAVACSPAGRRRGPFTRNLRLPSSCAGSGPGDQGPGGGRRPCGATADAQVLKLLKLPDDTEPTHFDLWIERPGANLQSWPGQRAMGTAFVGRIPLADGAGSCCVVSRQGPIAPGSITLPKPSEEEIARMLDAAAENRLDGTMVGLHDGTVVLMDGRFDPDSVRVLGLMAAAHRAGPPSG